MMRRWLGAAAAVLALSSCSQDRSGTSAAPVFDTDVAPIFEKRCVPCHGASAPAAGWNASTYLSAIACVTPSGAPATLPAGGAAPLLAALDQPPHQSLLDAGERAIVTAWVQAGAPAFATDVHPPGIIDPRSGDFHGAMLRRLRWAPMLDPNDPQACGRCHDGSPAAVPGVSVFAPGATACTSCHDQPGGALACGTCHGSGTRAYPPRDLCFFPQDAAKAGAHAAHVEPSAAAAAGFPCKTCHPVPGSPVLGGFHGDGSVEVIFDAPRIGPEISYDRTTGVCAVTCHDAGGLRPRPVWSDTRPMGCNDCHSSPPAGHYPGACPRCHVEANGAGTALSGGPLHLDGRVELGDGSGQCGACHGHGDDPWPATAAHPAHKMPAISAPVACASCHPVPASILDPLHLDGTVHLAFSGLALARGSQPLWDGRSCRSVACHGAGLADPPAVVPVWTDTSGAAAACGACHGIPPTQHTPSIECGNANCHPGEVALGITGIPALTPAGRLLHINGVIDVFRP